MKEVNNFRITLGELLEGSGLSVDEGSKNEKIEISGINFDSRQINRGDLFVAVEGDYFDGHDYIQAAIHKGASAVLGSKSIEKLGVPYIKTDNTRHALACLSAAFYRFPARSLTVIAVTGTDGKTTTINLIYKILLSCGIRAGMISTVNAVIGEDVVDTGFHVTTPEAPTIQKYLRKMVDADLTHVVLEATSHGLDQERVSACEIDLAVFTNITHEHLDYHGDYRSYFNAKFRLIEELAKTYKKKTPSQKIAVINQDDISYSWFVDRLKKDHLDEIINPISYGSQSENRIWYKDLKSNADGLQFKVMVDTRELKVTSPLIGTYNVSNILAAMGAAIIGLRLEPEAVLNGIASLDYVPGRMERIDLGQEFLAIVDFAHTPNALRVALQTARNMTNKRIIVVFGSAGLRDRQKRRMMAEQSIELADISIFTAEDPRTENLKDILQEMANEADLHGGIQGQNYLVVEDRGEAIRQAIKMAQKDDLVMACGKGHEQSMCFGTTEFDWDDRTAMRAALAELLDMPGPQMPYLPTQDKK